VERSFTSGTAGERALVVTPTLACFARLFHGLAHPHTPPALSKRLSQVRQTKHASRIRRSIDEHADSRTPMLIERDLSDGFESGFVDPNAGGVILGRVRDPEPLRFC
jgi:hypothetical protein